MTDMENVRALGEIRFAMRLQTVCSLLQNIGAVPAEYDTRLKAALAELEMLKADAFGKLNGKYEIKERVE